MRFVVDLEEEKFSCKKDRWKIAFDSLLELSSYRSYNENLPRKTTEMIVYVQLVNVDDDLKRNISSTIKNKYGRLRTKYGG